MSVKNSLMQKKTSFKALWHSIESIYGEIPELIKLVLQINGFDSFLALRGIRYEDKNEFFNSLESTVLELVTSSDESSEKAALERILGQNCKSFKLKPGHRNLIMNLMIEIDKVDVEEFFSKAQDKSTKDEKIQEAISGNEQTEKVSNYPSVSETTVKSIPKQTEPVLYQISDHIYTNEETVSLEHDQHYGNIDYEEEYILEEYMEDHPGRYICKMEDSKSEVSFTLINTTKKKQAKKRRPDRMYNDEFLSQRMNPRKRRVSIKKPYPDTDEGIQERFYDLVKQSMECILSQSKLDEVANVPIEVSKETDTSWIVACPLCEANIKLPVVIENDGRYKNYKRSNFERHLRFKHCKEEKSMAEEIIALQDY